MRIAILSDIHDHIWNLEKVLTREDVQETGALIFCGDFCAPFTLKQIADSFAGPVHAIFGNNDGDKFLLSKVAQGAKNVTLYDEMGEVEYEGVRLAFVHYTRLGRYLAASGHFAAVFSGHTHEAGQETIGKTLWANPGEIMGRFGSPSYGIYDTETGVFTLRVL